MGMIAESTGDALCIAVVRAVVADLAADELEYFDELVSGNCTSNQIDDAALGFGVGDAMQLITPVILEAVSSALRYVAPRLFDAALEVGKDAAKENIKARIAERAGNEAGKHRAALGAKAATIVEIVFSQEQLKVIHRTATKQCARMGMDDIQCHAFADAVVSNIAMRSQRTP